MSRTAIGILVLLLMMTAALVTQARPGGGQSFRSSSPSYDSSSSSSSGSSWGSSDSSSSKSSGSSWSWGSSSKSSSSSSSSSRDTSSGSSYDSYRSSESYDRQMAEVRCMQSCMGKPLEEMSTCMDECRSPKTTASNDRYRGYYKSNEDRPTAAPPAPDPPLSTYFLWPGILLGVVGAGAGVRYILKKRDEQFWAAMGENLDSGLDQQWRAQQARAAARQPSIRAALRALQGTDDAFSWVLFEDFVHALFVEAHTLRGKNQLGLLRPYFTQNALVTLAALPKNGVHAIVVGGLETFEITTDAESRRVRVRIAIEANYAEGAPGAAQSYAVREVWTLGRGADIVSRPPERARVIGCPSCGAPLDKLVGDTCAHCGAPSAPGSRDWEVETIEIPHRATRAPQLTGTTEEQGTDLPTLVAPDVKGEFGALAVRDPEFSWAAFVARAEHVFHTFYRAWNAQDLAPVRPYLSDQMLEAQRYWIEAYRSQQLKNVAESPEIVSIALSRLLHDKYFDSLTVRIFAQCKDYTLDQADNVVGGSRDALRRYSEYWTFIRSASKRGASSQDPVCPNCGAPIEHVNMAGECAQCKVEITTGQFDWVLSRIEQDEVYRL